MHLDYAHFSGKGNFYGRHATAKRRETPFSRTSRSKTHIHIVFPRGWPSCFFCFFLYRGGGAEGREHETGFLCFSPFPAFYFLGLIISPRPYWLCPGFSGFTTGTTYFSPLSSSSSTDNSKPCGPPNRSEREIGRTWKVPLLFLPSQLPEILPLLRKESAPYTPVPPILSPSASQGRG